MSTGPSTLGSLLTTRLDTVLGTTVAQHPAVLEGTRTSVVSPGATVHGQDTSIRDTNQPPGARHATVQERGSAGIRPETPGAGAAKAGADKAQALAGRLSARIQLSDAGKLMLALLLTQHRGQPVSRSQQPLWQPRMQPLPLPVQARAQRGADPGSGHQARPAARPSSGAPGSAAGTGSPAGGQAAQAGTPATGGPQLPQSGMQNGAQAGTQFPSGTEPARQDWSDSPPSTQGNTSGASQATGRPAGTTPGQVANNLSAGATGQTQAASGTLRADVPLPQSSPASTQATPAGVTETRSAEAWRPVHATAATALARVLPSFTGPAATLARSLAETVIFSGAFYEAHLAELAFGARPFAAIWREPQARLTWERTPDAQQQAHATRGGAQSADSSASISRTGGLLNAGAGALNAIHPDALSYVHQQLDILANGCFAWLGEVWPGAQMYWEIREQGREHAEEAPEEVTWSTRLRIRLPRLGDVEAVIRVQDERCSVTLVAPQGAEVLSAQRVRLQERFEAANLALSQLLISREMVDPAPPAPAQPPASAPL